MVVADYSHIIAMLLLYHIKLHDNELYKNRLGIYEHVYALAFKIEKQIYVYDIGILKLPIIFEWNTIGFEQVNNTRNEPKRRRVSFGIQHWLH